MLFDIKYNDFWLESWGKIENNNFDWKKEKFLKIYEKVPRLIPIYSHRYMLVNNDENAPILSVMGSDIIVYGENLKDYLEEEFNLVKKEKKSHNVKTIRFWSEIIENY